MITIKKIVVATDFTSGSRHPIRFSVDFARKTSAELHLLYAYVERRFFSADDLRDRLIGMIPENVHDVHIEYHVEVGTAVAPIVLRFVAQQNADVIVMGTRCPQSSTPGLLGDATRKVLYQAETPVITVDTVGSSDEPVSSVLVPIDGSVVSVPVVETAKRLAARYKARLDLLHVITEPRFPGFYPWASSSLLQEAPDLRERAIHALQNIAREAKGPEVEVCTLVKVGVPAEAILAAVKEQGSGLLLMATHCCAGEAQLPASNVTETVARHSPAPVCTIKTASPGFYT